MTPEERFYYQLARTIQTWLWVETEAYLLYCALMRGANSHFVSVTFHYIRSFESKLGLIDSCIALLVGNESDDWKVWRGLFNRATKLNKKRNKIVHESVSIEHRDGTITMSIHPSYLNALAVAKGQTTHRGSIVSSSYEPSKAKLLEDHKVTLSGLCSLGQSFKVFSQELRGFREHITEMNKAPK